MANNKSIKDRLLRLEEGALRVWMVLLLGFVFAVPAFGIAYASLGAIISGGLILFILSAAQYPLMLYAARHIRKKTNNQPGTEQDREYMK